MKIKEIHVGLSGVCPLAAYENLRPSYDMTIEPSDEETPEECFVKAQKIIRGQFENEVNRARTDLIEKQYSNIRFREKGGKKYPSVTSITGWDINWRISDDELQQYAARGTIVHRLIEEYIKTGIWAEPEMLKDLKDDLIILATGSLNLDWKVCSHEKFFEVNEKDFEWLEGEKEVFNEEHVYSGRYDRKAIYKGKLSIVDWKTGSNYNHRQTAAYAVCEEKIEQLVICPVGQTNNKSGYKKPDVTEDVKGNFKAFLKKRQGFRARFGI